MLKPRAGSGVLRARAGGHEENPAADLRQPAGVEEDRGRVAAGVPDAGGVAAEDPEQAEGRAAARAGGVEGQQGEGSEAPGLPRHSREQRQGTDRDRAHFL